MIDERILEELREQLLQRREEIVERRRTANRSWQVLQEPEAEMEEAAIKENLSRELEQLEDLIRTQERQIDDALEKMGQGDYGECEKCGRTISLKRLRLVPWARLCVRCAQEQELSHAGQPAARAVPAEETGPLDEETCEIIQGELEEDGRVELEELEVRCEDGVVYLEGALPSRQSLELIRQIVSDSLDYDRVVENIKIDRQPWERRERNPGRIAAAKPKKEIWMEGENEDVDTFTSMRDGKPMQPPDRLSPEKKRTR